jgi:hypothetical protein
MKNVNGDHFKQRPSFRAHKKNLENSANTLKVAVRNGWGTDFAHLSAFCDLPLLASAPQKEREVLAELEVRQIIRERGACFLLTTVLGDQSVVW